MTREQQHLGIYSGISAMASSRRAITRLQTILIIFVVIVGVASATYYYTNPPAPPTAPAPFSVQVIPEEVFDSYPSQQCVLLVAVKDEGNGSLEGEAVSLTVSVLRADVDLEPQEITPGQVAEVTVIPLVESANFNLNVTITGERGGLTNASSSIIQVGVAYIDGDEDPLGEYAREIQSKFIPWVAANYPEFEITDETEWTGISIRPHFMVVMYYLFLSDEWEMGLTWHVMIPPYDWARIYLRHRYTELSPSYAFEISSLEANEEPHLVTLEDAFAESVWR